MDTERLKDARKKAGYTQSELSLILDVPLGTYRNWEQGKNAPNTKYMIELSKILRVTIDYLMGLPDMNNAYYMRPDDELKHKIKQLNTNGLNALNEYVDFLLTQDRYTN